MKPARLYRPILLLALPVALITLACNLANQGFNTPTPEDCLSASNSPGDDDLEYALNYTGDIFQGDDWEQSHQVRDERITVTWLNVKDSAITHLEYVVFPCGYNQETLDSYFSDSNFEEVIFQVYNNVRLGDACQQSNTLTLQELQAESGEFDYNVRFWIVSDQPNRVLDIFIAYPVDRATNLEDYANDLFPQLASCQS